MKRAICLSILLASLGLTACSGDSDSGPGSDPALNAEARYRVTFSDQWSATNFPTRYPGNAHFSGLIGTTHNAQTIFWEVGQAATSGIESMAETGAKGALITEINVAKANGSAEFLISGGGIGSTPGAVSVEFGVTRDYPLVSLVSMVAPSPDWFVGVDRLNLLENGQFVDSKRVSLSVYDAGSDSGATFTSGNANSQDTITRLNCASGDCDFLNGENRNPPPTFIGEFLFERIQ